ncbi:hypothetical protein W822_20775 [Advenella kashmirensis W13003]|uniref:Uncharacterized protein n=1 Tax=Advenella kashmirensis W13003 TaxID=1424334 RepID=V8QPN9_9BURK|nr:hypothetical protein W822_20775 [Advenella kashmirensis W13003]
MTFLEMNDVDGVPRWSARTRYVLSVYILGGCLLLFSMGIPCIGLNGTGYVLRYVRAVAERSGMIKIIFVWLLISTVFDTI